MARLSPSPVLRVGLVGFGLSGRYLQAPFYRAHPGFAVRRVVTSRAKELAEEFPHLKPTRGLEEVLADPSIDLVSIATPNATHYEMARAALEADKHVLVDKPAAATAAELRELRDLAARRGRHLFVFQNRRWDSDFLTLRRILDGGELGTLVNYEARYDRWKPQPNAKPWKEVDGPAAGMLYDLGAHIIDQAIVLFGRPREVSGKTWKQREGSRIYDAFDLALTYAEPLHVRLSCSLLVCEPTPRYTLHGRRGSYVKYGIDVQEDQLRAGIQPGAADFGREPTEQRGTLHRLDGEGALLRSQEPTRAGNWIKLFEAMHRTVTRGDPPAVHLEDVILQLEIIEAAERI